MFIALDIYPGWVGRITLMPSKCWEFLPLPSQLLNTKKSTISLSHRPLLKDQKKIKEGMLCRNHTEYDMRKDAF